MISSPPKPQPDAAPTRVIAIDGPAGSGKSSVARNLADRLGFTLLDTGALYRAVALRARQASISWDDEQRLAELAAALGIEFFRSGGDNRIRVDGEDVTEAIRSPDISQGASAVSRHPAVRQTLLEQQRDFARRGPVVAEGRDVATVVFPQAAVKVYLDAAVEERARRRYEQLREAGQQVAYEQVLAAAIARDAADSSRAVAPLRPAEGALRIDSTELQMQQVVDLIAALAEQAIGAIRTDGS